ncbi:hypothetical protein GCM10008931_30520 [Oceanobacillus oncorhynchi subsp. oncorhynchi]|uniref:hypothetical protein n=1 Tax=Oceanobacillus oncorhynchi TaxID=545501 RepID=UPI0031E47E04
MDWRYCAAINLLFITGGSFDDGKKLPEESPMIDVRLVESEDIINQSNGVVCWGNCNSEHMGFHIDNVDDSVWENLEVNTINSEEVNISIEGERPPDVYGYFALTEKGNTTTGHNEYTGSNTFHIDESPSKYMVIAQWENEGGELQGYVYSVFETE